MQVRDQDGIDGPRHARRRAVATEMRDSGAKHRVGEDAHAPELYEHRGVPDVSDASGRWRDGRDCRRGPGDAASPRLGDSRSPQQISRIAAMRGRGIGVGALLVIGTLLWTGLGFAVWANRQALDTDNWVDTSGALLEDEEIRTAVGLFIIDRLYQSEEVEAQLAEVLPPRLVPLAKPAAAGLKQVAQRNAGRVLGTAPPSRRGRPPTGPRTRR